MDRPIVYVDLDGVCTDLLGDLYRVFAKPFPPPKWPMTYEDIQEQFGLGREEFWAEIDRRAPAFWSGMTEYPWCDELLTTVAEFGQLTVVTSPSSSSAACAGKVEWLLRKFGIDFRDFIITSRRSMLARPGRWLIDDAPEQVTAFNAAGGHGLLFPQPWNLSSGNPRSFITQLAWLLRKDESMSNPMPIW
jgi:5'(3')-deoxyribonucleotidase